MNAFDIKIDIAGFDRTVKERSVGIAKRLKRGLHKGVRNFEGLMIRRFFSGRPGLRRRTGTAASSWRVRKIFESNNDLVLTLANSPRAWYIVVHQRGATIYPKRGRFLRFKIPGVGWRTSTRPIQIPKRLHIPETFKRLGGEMLRRAMVYEAIHGR